MMNLFKKQQYKIASTIAENQMEMDIAFFLGAISPLSGFYWTLQKLDEKVYGADAKFDCAIPLYLQFKVSQGLKSIDVVKPSGRANESYLEGIRRFRNENKLFDNPSLYFELRDKAKHAEEYQHNILLSLANTGFSKAFYVAPLTLCHDDYTEKLYKSLNGFSPIFPFYDIPVIEIYQRQWTSYIGSVPFLRAHVSIIPHERVDTHKHCYAFGTNGSDISWHSPKNLSGDVLRLSDALYQVYNAAFSNKELWHDLADLNRNLRSTIPDLNSSFSDGNQNQLEGLKQFGRELYNKYNIYQLLILSKKDKLPIYS